MGKFWSVLLLLFFTLSFLFVSDHSFDQDLGRHLKLGEIIWQTHQVPKTNLFSYTNPDFPFVNTHWLFEVLAYLTSQSVGLQVLLVFKIAVILFSVWLTLKTIPQENRLLLLPIGFIFLHVLRERLELRPEIFSFLFTALTFWILNRFFMSSPPRRGSNNLLELMFNRRGLLFLLPFIQFIWVNTHIYFFVGLLFQFIYIIHLGYQNLRSHMSSGNTDLKVLSVVFTLSVLASLINPHGLTGLLYPLDVTKNYGYTIVENQNIFFLENIHFRDPNFLFVKICAGLIILSLIIGGLRRTLSVKSVLLSLTGLGLALMYVRSFPYLVFLSLPAMMENLGPLSVHSSWFMVKWIPVYTGMTIVSALLLLESLFYLSGDYYKNIDSDRVPKLTFQQHSQNALDFVLKNDLPQPIFNNFDIGSFIIYRGFPKYRVFVDGRPEAYPADFFTGIYIPAQSDYKNFQTVEAQINFQTVIFSHTDQTPWAKNFLQNVIKDSNWRLVYLDDFMVVLVKTKVAEEKKLTPVNLSTLDPESYRFNSHVAYLRLAFFLLNASYPESTKSFVNKTLTIFPDSPVGSQQLSKIFW